MPALLVLFAVLEFLVGGLTADTGLEFYVFAWATLAGGLWFLFDKVERTASADVRASAAAWITTTDARAAAGSLPSRFAGLFDRVFGSKHLAWKCFRRSALATFVAVLAIYLIHLAGSQPFGMFAGVPPYETVMWVVLPPLLINVVPDYLSLLETRYLLTLLGDSPSALRVLAFLIIDVAATALLGILVIALYVVLNMRLFGGFPAGWFADVAGNLGVPFSEMLALSPQITLETSTSVRVIGFPLGVYFYSSFLTSAWLWVYGLAMALSRILVRLGDGVGVLLKVTDVEAQPFRSLGFVSVILVSVLFVLGLPIVLL